MAGALIFLLGVLCGMLTLIVASAICGANGRDDG